MPRTRFSESIRWDSRAVRAAVKPLSGTMMLKVRAPGTTPSKCREMQVQGPETGDTTIVNEHRERLMTSDPILHMSEVPLQNANSAIAYQQSKIGANLGKYDERTNSCVDHVANVLRAGGADVP